MISFFSRMNLVFQTHHGLQKVLSTVVFLYFACLLPSIAFGVLNSQMTNDQISVPKAVASQCLGGIFFSIFAGQPLIVVMTTAPLTLYVKGNFHSIDKRNKSMPCSFTLYSHFDLVHVVSTRFSRQICISWLVEFVFPDFILLVWSFEDNEMVNQVGKENDYEN